MALGDLFGSVVANSTLILGLTSLINPIKLENGIKEYLLAAAVYGGMFFAVVAFGGNEEEVGAMGRVGADRGVRGVCVAGVGGIRPQRGNKGLTRKFFSSTAQTCDVLDRAMHLGDILRASLCFCLH